MLLKQQQDARELFRSKKQQLVKLELSQRILKAKFKCASPTLLHAQQKINCGAFVDEQQFINLFLMLQ